MENHTEDELKVDSGCQISKSMCRRRTVSEQFTNQPADECDVTYEAPGVNFYLRLGAIGEIISKYSIVSPSMNFFSQFNLLAYNLKFLNVIYIFKAGLYSE